MKTHRSQFEGRRAEQPTASRPAPTLAGITHLSLAFLLGIGLSLLAVPWPDTHTKRSARAETMPASPSKPDAPDSLLGAIGLPDGQRAALDIARLNLLCADGLPGSDNVDITAALAQLDAWARRVLVDTERHMYRFREAPATYERSEAYFRMLMLTTVLQQDFSVRYNPERVRQPDFRDSRDLFIHGLLGDTRTGTCVSMPVLTVAVGRRLGYPLKLALAKSHVFVRWDDGSTKPINFETTSLGVHMYDEAYYAQWPEPISPSERAAGAYLRSLTPDEELAVFLQARGHCLFDNGRLPEAQAAYAQAHVLAPAMPYGLDFLAEAVRREADAFPEYQRRRSPMRTADEMAALVERINAENTARLRDFARGAGQVPSSRIPFGGMP